MASSKSVVIAALFANGAIAILKFIGFLLTGSPAMLSEVYHSVSDTANQVFLLIGIRYGAKDASRSHPFGYGKAQFFYALLVSVMLFGIAGWESLNHGWHAINHPTPVETGDVTLPVVAATIPRVWVNYTVLTGAILFELYAFKKAYAAISLQIDANDWDGIVEAFRKTSDITTLTALTEDTIAMAGAGIALVGVYLSQITENPIYDAVSAFIIGLLLMGFAIALAWENKRLILGESLAKDAESSLESIVADWAGVEDVRDFRTVFFGPQRLIVTADVAFAPGMDTEAIDDEITKMEQELRAAEAKVKEVYIEPEIEGGSSADSTA
jgi:cation diffusion facilitator family transporter